MDALIDSIVDCPPDKSMLHLSVYIASLYDTAHALKDKAFTEQLRHEHRQYHHDVLAGMDHATLPFIAHQRHIRSALRQGTHEPTECSTSLDNELLFSRPVQARLLVSMRKPVVDLEEELERAGRCTTKQEGSGKSSGGCCGLIRGLGRVSWQWVRDSGCLGIRGKREMRGARDERSWCC